MKILDPPWLSPDRAPPGDSSEIGLSNKINNNNNNINNNNSNSKSLSLPAGLVITPIITTGTVANSSASVPKMKYGTSSGGDSEVLGMPVDSLLLNSCWSTDHFIVDSNSKNLLIGEDSEEENESKTGIDDLELLLTAGSHEQNNNLAELKPLPPFPAYTAHLSINGISGHHYQAIAESDRSGRGVGSHPPETNNNSAETTNQNAMYYDQVVSSSTMDCTMDIKTENGMADYNHLLNAPDIEDIAAIIGSAIAADTTVNGNNGGDNSRDSWMDLDRLDAWIDNACETNSTPSTSKNNGHSCGNGMSVLHNNDSMSDFVTHNHSSFTISPPPSIIFQGNVNIKRENASSTFPHMPLLQSRLQNGPPIKSDIGFTLVPECPSPSSSTHFIAHSPPGHVVTSSDLVRSAYNPVHSSTRPSPELQVSFPQPHTTTPSKPKPRNRSKKPSVTPTSTVVFDSLGGKEKPVHRCNICNRGFLNKSNIKVHLRTHTGEKPFRCEVCGKAFRQKAHLIKHAQIHKRIGRD